MGCATMKNETLRQISAWCFCAKSASFWHYCPLLGVWAPQQVLPHEEILSCLYDFTQNMEVFQMVLSQLQFSAELCRNINNSNSSWNMNKGLFNAFSFFVAHGKPKLNDVAEALLKRYSVKSWTCKHTFPLLWNSFQFFHCSLWIKSVVSCQSSSWTKFPTRAVELVLKCLTLVLKTFHFLHCCFLLLQSNCNNCWAKCFAPK